MELSYVKIFSFTLVVLRKVNERIWVMKKLFLSFLLLFVFRYCEAQQLVIMFYPSFHHYGKSLIMCNGDTCTLQFIVIHRKDSSIILLSETQFVPVKYINDIKKIFEIAKNLTSTEPNCFDGMDISGKFKSNNLHNEFVCYCPFSGLQYDFARQSITTMRKILNNRKLKRYTRALKQYL